MATGWQSQSEGPIKFHINHGKIATVTGIHAASRFGELKVEGDNVLSFREKPPTGADLISGGFYVFNRDVFDYVWDDDNCDFEYGPLEQIANEGQLKVYKHTSTWACMDTLRDMDYLKELLSEKKAFWKVGNEPHI